MAGFGGISGSEKGGPSVSVMGRRFRSTWVTGFIAVLLAAGLTSGLADAGEKAGSRPRSPKWRPNRRERAQPYE